MVTITVEKEDVETLSVKIHLTGLTPGTRYDVFRLQIRYSGKDAAGVRQYARDIPDRRAYWSTVAHRVGWQAPAASASFRDFDCPPRPTMFFICPSSAGGPHEWFSNGNAGTYPIGRGVLATEVVHFKLDIAELDLDAEPDVGHILVRSVHELAHYANCCLVEMDGPTYTARVNEHAVMGSQYPVVISDSREARRGTITLMTRNLSQYDDLRRVCWPPSGRIRPVLFQGGGDSTLLLDDLRALVLDVEVEQASKFDGDIRYIHLDYVELDPATPLISRSGDDDLLVDPPETNFSVSDGTPHTGDWIWLTDTSTGQGDEWEWSVPGAVDNRMGKFFGQGPHRVRYSSRGKHEVKLRFGGSGAGYQSRTKTVNVGG